MVNARARVRFRVRVMVNPNLGSWLGAWGVGVTFTDFKDPSSRSHQHHCCWAGETTAQPGSDMLKLPGRVRG